MRVAAIDIGTNSVLLSVAERTPGGAIRVLLDRATVTRLGQGVDRTRRLDPEAVARTLDCLKRYGEELREWRVDQITVVGTSALRDADNAATFTRSAEALLGTTPRVIEGGVEAELTFRGALSGLSLSGLTLEGPVIVLDIGGGSTEVIVGSAATGDVRATRFSSFDVGCVRLTERHIVADPPDPEALAQVAESTRSALLRFDLGEPIGAMIAVAGTATTLAAMHLGLPTYDSSQVHGCVLSLQDVEQLVRRVSAVSLAERCTLVGLDARRADVIVAGSVMLATALRVFGRDRVIVSDRGVRFGLLDAMLGSVAP